MTIESDSADEVDRTGSPVTGGCLCGAVRWSTAAPLRPVFECHCHRCRRLTGDHFAASGVPTDDLSVSDDEQALRWFSPVDDANVGYGFCARCGSTMFFRAGLADGLDVFTSLTIGTFDCDPVLATTEIWFCDEARAHVRLPGPDSGVVLHPHNG